MKKGAHRHPKIKALGRITGKGRIWAVGCMDTLCAETAEFAIRGDIGRLTDEDIAEWVDWPEDDAERLVSALIQAGLVDQHPEHRLVLHDWHDHMPGWVAKELKRRGTPPLSLCVSDENTESRHSGPPPETLSPAEAGTHSDPTHPIPTHSNPTQPNPGHAMSGPSAASGGQARIDPNHLKRVLAEWKGSPLTVGELAQIDRSLALEFRRCPVGTTGEVRIRGDRVDRGELVERAVNAAIANGKRWIRPAKAAEYLVEVIADCRAREDWPLTYGDAVPSGAADDDWSKL